MSLTMAGLELRASNLLTKASSCWMRAGGGSARTGSKQDRVDRWTPCSGHDKASSSRDNSCSKDLHQHINVFHDQKWSSSISLADTWSCSKQSIAYPGEFRDLDLLGQVVDDVRQSFQVVWLLLCGIRNSKENQNKHANKNFNNWLWFKNKA